MPAFDAAIACVSSVFDNLYSLLICWSVTMRKALSKRFPHRLNSPHIGRNNCRQQGTLIVADHWPRQPFNIRTFSGALSWLAFLRSRKDSSYPLARRLTSFLLLSFDDGVGISDRYWLPASPRLQAATI
jgi:hypothetical protein